MPDEPGSCPPANTIAGTSVANSARVTGRFISRLLLSQTDLGLADQPIVEKAGGYIRAVGVSPLVDGQDIITQRRATEFDRQSAKGQPRRTEKDALPVHVFLFEGFVHFVREAVRVP